jgi:hypothetical protein
MSVDLNNKENISDRENKGDLGLSGVGTKYLGKSATISSGSSRSSRSFGKILDNARNELQEESDQKLALKHQLEEVSK